jgi:hypothetical protein
LSPGEVHFLWWFIQGSIMEPETRWQLRLGWGMCQRHILGALAAEAAFRHGYLHGPAVLYADLMERALRAFELAGPLAAARLARRLRARARCQMCELGYGPASQGFISAERVQQGRDLSHLMSFLLECRSFWRESVCGRCASDDTKARCRTHLLEDLRSDPSLDLGPHRALVKRISRHMQRYDASFRWDLCGTDTSEERAALVSAAGWCGGWQALLSCIDEWQSSPVHL